VRVRTRCVCHRSPHSHWDDRRLRYRRHSCSWCSAATSPLQQMQPLRNTTCGILGCVHLHTWTTILFKAGASNESLVWHRVMMALWATGASS
jgi:hypothetical protein